MLDLETYTQGMNIDKPRLDILDNPLVSMVSLGALATSAVSANARGGRLN